MDSEKATLEVVAARGLRQDIMLNDHEKRLRDIERNQYADYQWRQATDKTLTAINTKLETLLSEDGKTYHTAKIAVVTTFVSSVVGYVIGVLLK